jgi:hypothetical protein
MMVILLCCRPSAVTNACSISPAILASQNGKTVWPAEALCDAAELAIRKKANQLGEDVLAFIHPSILAGWAGCRRGFLIAASKNTPIKCLVYIGCETETQLLPNSRETQTLSVSHPFCNNTCEMDGTPKSTVRAKML